MAKILLVDDHPDVVRLLEVTLQREGYTLLKAYNGLQALEQVRAERPDLVILDVVMPELDGIRVLNRIKTDPELEKTVVVMLTARDTPEDVTLGLDVGSDYYLCKPFRPADVTSLVRRVLANADSGA
jgi:two-component system, OmpR family, alkaline phosphatase synthesis response regulator PhoP